MITITTIIIIIIIIIIITIIMKENEMYRLYGRTQFLWQAFEETN